MHSDSVIIPAQGDGDLIKPHKSQHWNNPETGQAECDCCCGWALDMEVERKKHAAELAAAQERIRELESALRSIGKIEDKLFGGDWDEITEARAIADTALCTYAAVKGEGK